MFNFIKTSRYLMVAIVAAGVISCEEDDDFAIPQSNVEEIIPREEKIVVTDIVLTASNQYILEGNAETVAIEALAPEAVTKVAFYRGDELLGEDSEKPFTTQVEISDALTAFENVEITARGFAGDVRSGDNTIFIYIGEKIEAEAGVLVGDGNEVWNENPNDDGLHAGMINFDGGGDLEKASGINIPLKLEQAGNYKILLALASGWGDGRSAFVYLNDDVEGAQEVVAEVVDPTWVAFKSYEAADPFTLTEGDHMIKYRKGQTYVHVDYLELYKVE